MVVVVAGVEVVVGSESGSGGGDNNNFDYTYSNINIVFQVFQGFRCARVNFDFDSSQTQTVSDLDKLVVGVWIGLCW